jgi:hypothetical protein
MLGEESSSKKRGNFLLFYSIASFCLQGSSKPLRGLELLLL